jgi:uncharacterized damage-inducible protein DinB
MTRIEPPDAADERTLLDAMLDYQRATLLLKTEGLDRALLNTALAPSSLTLAGLLKHLAFVEDRWIQSRFLGRPDNELEPWGAAPWHEDRDWEFTSAADDDPDDLRELYRAACERSRRATAGRGLDELVLTAGRDGERWNLRWILLHLIEETARHCGHADLIREAVDGSVGE